MRRHEDSIAIITGGSQGISATPSLAPSRASDEVAQSPTGKRTRREAI